MIIHDYLTSNSLSLSRSLDFNSSALPTQSLGDALILLTRLNSLLLFLILANCASFSRSFLPSSLLVSNILKHNEINPFLAALAIHCTNLSHLHLQILVFIIHVTTWWDWWKLFYTWTLNIFHGIMPKSITWKNISEFLRVKKKYEK